jgi:hypothetical protein
MRIRTIVICAMTALGVTACGSAGSRSASLATPPGPVVLSALVSGAHVSVSPARVGAGPVLLTVTNQGRHSAAVTLSRGGRSLARTAPINPQGATQIKVSLSRGVYRVALASSGSRRTDAQKSRGAQPASGALVHVGRRRSGGANQLLSP